jgi:hypothetical protein
MLRYSTFLIELTVLFIFGGLLLFLPLNQAVIVVVITWVYSILIPIDKANIVSSLYLFLFGIFFVLPPLFLGGEKFLEQGVYFTSIWLSVDEIRILLFSVFLFLSSFRLTIRLMPKLEPSQEPFLNYELKNKHFLLVLCLVSFLWITTFNIQEALAVLRQGYGALFDNTLSVQKGLTTFFIEQIFLGTSFLLILFKNKVGLYLLLIYGLTMMFVGQRMPPLFLCVFAVLIFRHLEGKKTRLILYSTIGFLLLSPILMFVQDFREGIEPLENLDMYRYYTDIWNVIGFSLDTLKAVVSYDGIYPVDISPISRLYKFVEVILIRIFDVSAPSFPQGFSLEFTRSLEPELYLAGRTFASSSIAEAYFFAGYFGVSLSGIFAATISKFGSKALHRKSLFMIAGFLIFMPKFFVSVRNELFGWLVEGMIYYVALLPFLYGINWLFIHQQQFRSYYDQKNMTALN